MRYLIVLAFLLLVGCTVPVPLAQDFPEVPKSFMAAPAPLKEVPDNSTFSAMLDIMLDNYSLYYLLTDDIKSWQEWYVKNKEIFDKAK